MATPTNKELIEERQEILREIWSFCGVTGVKAQSDCKDLYKKLKLHIDATYILDSISIREKLEIIDELMLNNDSNIDSIASTLITEPPSHTYTKDEISKMIRENIYLYLCDVFVPNSPTVTLKDKDIGANAHDIAEIVNNWIDKETKDGTISEKKFIELFNEYCTATFGVINKSNIYSIDSQNDLKNRAEIYDRIITTYTVYDKPSTWSKPASGVAPENFFIKKDDLYPLSSLPDTVWDKFLNTSLIASTSTKDAGEICEVLDEQLMPHFIPKSTSKPIKPKTYVPESTFGLVVGQVQSGKTGFVLGAVAKACDANYNCVIVLTSNITLLFDQTYKRFNKNLLKPNYSYKINIIDASGEFFELPSNKGRGNKFSYDDGDKRTSIYVIKKQKQITTNLAEALEHFFNDPSIGPYPYTSNVLIIDDEGDHSSLDTSDNTKDKTTKTAKTAKKAKEDRIAVINNNIIQILSKFDYFHYLSLTATPFANIISPRTPYDQDKPFTLYPKNYAIATPTSDNYIGVFKTHFKFETSHRKDQGIHHHQVMNMKDDWLYIEEETDEKDKKIKNLMAKDEFLSTLEESLYSFYIVNAIRDLRNHLGHRSMIVNLSKEKDHHKKWYDILKVMHEEAMTDLKTIGSTSENAIKKVFETVYNDTTPHPNGNGHCYKTICDKESITWDNVLQKIKEKISVITLHISNSVNYGADVLKAPKYKEDNEIAPGEEHVRAIVFGGQSLSRGVTFEGLCITVLHRTTTSYDTLLQMARWFGYRKGYEDLFKVYLNNTIIEYFEYIGLTLDNLMNQIDFIAKFELTPEEFNLDLKYFSPPDEVEDAKFHNLTDAMKQKRGSYHNGRASNKRSQREVSKMNKENKKSKPAPTITNFYGTVSELNIFTIDPTMSQVTNNFSAINKFISKIKPIKQKVTTYNTKFELGNNRALYVKKDVDIKDIVSFIESFNCQNLNKENLLNFLDQIAVKNNLSKWDFAFSKKNSNRSKKVSSVSFGCVRGIKPYFRQSGAHLHITNNELKIYNYRTKANGYKDFLVGLDLSSTSPIDSTKTFSDYFEEVKNTLNVKTKTSNLTSLITKQSIDTDNKIFKDFHYKQRKPLLLINTNYLIDNNIVIGDETLEKLLTSNELQHLPIVTICIPNDIIKK